MPTTWVQTVSCLGSCYCFLADWFLLLPHSINTPHNTGLTSANPTNSLCVLLIKTFNGRLVSLEQALWTRPGWQPPPLVPFAPFLTVCRLFCFLSSPWKHTQCFPFCSFPMGCSFPIFQSADFFPSSPPTAPQPLWSSCCQPVHQILKHPHIYAPQSTSDGLHRQRLLSRGDAELGGMWLGSCCSYLHTHLTHSPEDRGSSI